MQPTLIGILGKPLAGKDTVAKAIQDLDPEVVVISLGDVVREVKSTGDTHRFWPLLKDSIAQSDAGGLVPDEPIFTCLTELIDDEIAKGTKNIVWVAGPRSEKELQLLDGWSRVHGFREEFLHVDVPDTEIYKRLQGRADGGRADDRGDVIGVRLSVFEEVTRPVIDRLRSEGRVVEINGLGSKEEVGRRAIESLRFTQRDPEITLPMMARR